MSAQLYAHPAMVHHHRKPMRKIVEDFQAQFGYIITPVGGVLHLIPVVKPKTEAA